MTNNRIRQLSVHADDPLRELFESCKTGDLACVRKLINAHTVNARDTAGRKSTPLHFAAGRLQFLSLPPTPPHRHLGLMLQYSERTMRNHCQIRYPRDGYAAQSLCAPRSRPYAIGYVFLLTLIERFFQLFFVSESSTVSCCSVSWSWGQPIIVMNRAINQKPIGTANWKCAASVHIIQMNCVPGLGSFGMRPTQVFVVVIIVSLF